MRYQPARDISHFPPSSCEVLRWCCHFIIQSIMRELTESCAAASGRPESGGYTHISRTLRGLLHVHPGQQNNRSPDRSSIVYVYLRRRPEPSDGCCVFVPISEQRRVTTALFQAENAQAPGKPWIGRQPFDLRRNGGLVKLQADNES